MLPVVNELFSVWTGFTSYVYLKHWMEGSVKIVLWLKYACDKILKTIPVNPYITDFEMFINVSA